MLKRITLIAVLLLLVSCIAGQRKSSKLKKDKTDEYTEKQVMETYWQVLAHGDMYSYFRFRKIDNNYFMDFKAVTYSVFAVNEGKKLYMKFKNGNTKKIYNLKYNISGYGDGYPPKGAGTDHQGISLTFSISKSDLKYFSKSKLNGLRLYGTEGYKETDVSPKFANNLNKQAKLILGNTANNNK